MKLRAAAVDIEAWDVAVIGAGPAGSVCACSALATSPRLRVALVDMAAFPRDKACGDAIQVDAADLLRELGYGAVFDSRPLVSRAVRNFPAALSRFGAGEYQQSHYIIEREIFDSYLFSGRCGKAPVIFPGTASWTRPLMPPPDSGG